MKICFTTNNKRRTLTNTDQVVKQYYKYKLYLTDIYLPHVMFISNLHYNIIIIIYCPSGQLKIWKC